jgi:hypothetical protein
LDQRLAPLRCIRSIDLHCLDTREQRATKVSHTRIINCVSTRS